jgi:hypothetical protein
MTQPAGVSRSGISLRDLSDPIRELTDAIRDITANLKAEFEAPRTSQRRRAEITARVALLKSIARKDDSRATAPSTFSSDHGTSEVLDFG